MTRKAGTRQKDVFDICVCVGFICICTHVMYVDVCMCVYICNVYFYVQLLSTHIFLLEMLRLRLETWAL
jgi:hypothetical protein